MRAEDVASLRRRFQALRADPTRRDVAADLAATFEGDLAEAHRDLVDENCGEGGRGGAIARLIGAAVASQLLRDPTHATFGPYALELVARLGGHISELHEPPRDARDENVLDPDDPFIAWRLGELAEDRTGA